jgi:hypothetical protein
MKIEDMLECLLASQEAVKNCHEEMMAQLGSLATQMDVFEETSNKMNQEKIEARIETGQESKEAKIKNGLEEVKVMDLEASPEETEVAEHQKVPYEEAAMDTMGALEDQYGDWCLAVRCRRWPKKQTLGDGGSQQKSAATHTQ